MAISDKLTYLNGTKTKIREGLNSLGADLDTEDTFRSYVDAIEGIYEDYPKITGEGESLSLDNTKQASMQIDYKGQTSQTGTPTPSSPIPINVVSGDNYIDICGKNLANVSSLSAQSTYLCPCKVGETYTISFKGMATSIDKRVFLRSYNGAFSTSLDSYVDAKVVAVTGSMANYTMTLTSTIDGFLYLRVAAGNTSYTLEDIQLEKGSASTTYEPYIGNTYPIHLGMKNLWNRTDVKDGFLPQSGSYPVTNSSYPNSKYIIVPLLTGQKLTLSGSTSSTGRVRCIDKDTNQVVNAFTATETEYYTTTHSFGDAFYNATITAKKDFLVGIMDYVSFNQYLIVNYGATPQYISDTPIELCKIGTHQDYIYKDNGSWYLHKEIGKVVLNGSEDWSKSSNTSVDRFIRSSTIPKATQGISNYFSVVTSLGTSVGTFYFNENQQVVNYSTYGTTTLATFKTWLGTNKPIVYYVLATPTNTLIEDTTLIEQLEALSS